MAMKFGCRTKLLLSLYCLNFRFFVETCKCCCPCPLRKHPLLLAGGTPGQLYPLHLHCSPREMQPLQHTGEADALRVQDMGE